jgi:D-beta-D-heptose 7-phosphate kinase/D-beta-D-heptose 1-phosphate adenosyltransferase
MKESKNTPQPKKFKILLLGDSCEDIYKYGTCERLNPEAPVPILKIERVVEREGMADNVYNNLLALGCDVTYYTNIAKISKIRFIDSRSGYQLLRVDYDIEVPPLKQKLDYTGYDAVVISDYDKGYITYEQIEDVRRRFNGVIFIDTKKRDLARLECCFIKINSSEFDNAKSFPDGVPSGLIVTMGKRGAKYNDVIYPAPVVEVFDVCGAGDTFLAALAYGYLETNNIEKAIKFANIASSITVQHEGVYAPTLEEVNAIKRNG